MADDMMLAGKLDLAAVSKLHSDLIAAEGDLSVNMQDVTQIGALCLQTFIAAARDAAEKGNRFDLTEVPEHITQQIESMGCDPANLAGDAA